MSAPARQMEALRRRAEHETRQRQGAAPLGVAARLVPGRPLNPLAKERT